MLTGNISDFGLWKCGIDSAFRHIPTNFMIPIKIKGRIRIMIKNLLNRRFWKCFLNND